MRVNTALAVACAAAAITVPSWAEEADGQRARLAELIRAADAVVRTRSHEGKPTDDGLVALRRSRPEVLKGVAPWRDWDIVVPPDALASLPKREARILFTRVDCAKIRLVLLPRQDAIQGDDPALVQQIRDMAHKDKKLAVAFSADKTTVQPSETITLRWRIRNVAEQPVTVYVGFRAWRLSYRMGGHTITSGSIGRSYGTRLAAGYRTLQPGATFERTRTVKADTPDGSVVQFYMAYSNVQNYVGRSPARATSRVDGVLFVAETGSVSVQVAAPGEAAFAELVKQLASASWTQQLAAMKVLARTRKAAGLPAVKKMARHPWSEVRLLAIRALALSREPLGDELKALLYDPVWRVRLRAAGACGRRRIEGAGPPLLALRTVSREAGEAGVLPEQASWRRYNSPLDKLNDPRLGDLLCRLLEAGRDDGHLLARIMGVERSILEHGMWRPTDDQKAQLRQQWQAYREKVPKPWTQQDLDREIAQCRARAFLDLKFHPKFAEVVELMKALQRAVGPYGREADQAKLRAMGKAVAPTTLHILRNWDPYVSGALFDLYAEWGFREAAPDLLAALLRFPSGAGAYAAVPAARLDPKLARPQLEPLANKQLTPAAALALLGQRRAVPLVMAQLRRIDETKMAHVSAGLAAVTGKRFHTWAEWVRWWRDEGSKQTWQ